MAMKKNMVRAGALAVLALAGGAGIYALSGAPGAGAQGPGAMGPMPVEVSITKTEPVTIWTTYSGRLVPVDYAVVRPQVGGVITEIRFEDGQRVEKGDILMVIDPRPYDAALKEAKANLASARNAAELARVELERAKGLIASSAISQKIYDERVSASRSAQAAVDAAAAQVQKAEIDLDHAYVKAPISGRAGRAELTVGNVAQAAGMAAPMLTSIVSDNGIYADFEVDEQTYLGSIRSDATDKEGEQKIPVQVLPGGREDLAVDGKISTFDNHIDANTGTIRARAFFENKDGALLPGMFVKVRMGRPSAEERIMVSEKSVGTDQNRKFVYVVDEANTVKYRQVELGESMKGRRVVLSGLKDGEKVIAEGIIKIRPDMPVQPMTAEQMAQMMKQQEEAAKAAAAQGAQKPAAGKGGH